MPTVFTLLYPVTRCRDRFVAAAGTSARTGQPRPIVKDEAANLTTGGFNNKPAPLVATQRLDDVRQMVLYLPFRDPEQLCQLKRRQSRPQQEFHQALPRSQGNIGCHAGWYANFADKERRDWTET